MLPLPESFCVEVPESFCVGAGWYCSEHFLMKNLVAKYIPQMSNNAPKIEAMMTVTLVLFPFGGTGFFSQYLMIAQ